MATGTIYDAVGNFPSVQDYQLQRQQLAANALQQQLVQHQISQLPLADQMTQLQLAHAGLENQQLMVHANALQGLNALLTGGQGAPSMQSAALGAGANAGSVGPTTANADRLSAAQASPAAAQTNRLASITGDQMAGFAVNNVVSPQLLDLYKEAKFGRPMQPGYLQKLDGSREYVGDPTKGVTLDGNGNVVQMPGASATLGSLAQATSQGTEAGKAMETPLPLGYIDATTGRPVGGSVYGLVHAGQPAPAPAGAATQPAQGMAPPTPLDQTTSPQQRAAVLSDMAKQGIDPSQASVNGAPMTANPQQQLDAAKAGGPATMQRFAATMRAAIQAAPMSDAHRQQALDGLQYDLYTPPGTPIHAMAGAQGLSAPVLTGGAAPAAPAAGGAPQLAGPAELAAREVNARNIAEQQTGVPLAGAKTTVEAAAKSGQDYQDKLHEEVDGMAALVQRNQALKPYLAAFQTGGIAPDQRLAIGNAIANMNWLPSGVKDTVSKWVAGGDPAVGKTIAYQLGGEAIQNMIQTLDGSSAKPNRAELMMMAKNKADLTSGNTTLGDIMQQQENIYRAHLAEQQALTGALQNGTYNPSTWRGTYSAQRDKALFANGTAPGGAQIVTPPPGTAPQAPAGVDSSAIAAELKRRGL